MAKQLKTTPVLVRASFPKPPDQPSKLMDWSKEIYRELENFRQLLDKLLRNAGSISGVSGGGGSDGDPGTPLFAINADTVDGYHATDIFRYARSWNFRHFDNESSGFVLRGRPNGGYFRLFVDDTDAELPIIAIESAPSDVAGDVKFSVSAYGPVLIGRYNSGVFRFLVNDTEAGAPMIGIEKLTSTSSINNLDEEFKKGFGWISRGRAQKKWWLWFVDDTQQEGVIAIEKFGFSN